MIASTAIVNPYPGLRPFDENESDLFFGREEQTDELLTRLGRSRFVAVVGTSGSGKSSLVRAGLLPSLVGGYLTAAGSHWRIALFRPGADPIGALRNALDRACPPRGNNADERIGLGMLETSLRRSSLGLVEAAHQAKLTPSENLLLIVDQFEELFRFGNVSRSHDEDRAAFVRLLLEAVRQREISIHVLITMRSDFLGDCSRFRDLPETINDGLYLIPRMTRDQVRLAITGPAAVTGNEVTPRLVQQLLNDLGDDADQLPLLQHALMRMWDRKVEGKDGSQAPIDLDDYEAIGRLGGALSGHANESWELLRDTRKQELAKRLFQCLTERGPDNREVRRPAVLGQVCAILESPPEEIAPVIDHFREEGRAFLMPPRRIPLEPRTVIDISHESLIRKWDKLREWVEEEAESAGEYRRLVEAAKLHQQGRQGLWTNPALEVALRWKERARPAASWAERYAAEFQPAMEFLDRSVEEEKKQAVREARARRAETNIKRWTALSIAILAVTVVFVLLYFQNQSLLRDSRANRAALRAVLVASQQDSALTDAVQLAAGSMLVGRSADSDDVIRKGLALLPKENFRAAHQDQVNSVAFSPDGKLLATASNDGFVRVLDSSTGREISRLKHADFVSAVAFAHAGRLVATASADRTARVMDVSTGKEKWRAEHGGPVTALAASPVSGSIATAAGANGDAEVRIYELESGAQRWRVSHQDTVNELAFSPNGRLVATASDDHTARVVDAESGRKRFQVAHGRQVTSVAFSAGGQYLATGSADGTAKVVSVRNGALLTEIRHLGAVTSLAFGADDRLLAVGSKDETARVMLVQSGAEVARLKHQGAVNRVAFSRDGRFVATASSDRTSRVIEALTGHEVSRLPQEGTVTAVTFSPDGNYVGTGSADQSARVFPAEAGAEALHVPDTTDVLSVALSVDGLLLATGGRERTARIWNLKTRRPDLSVYHGQQIFSLAFSPDGRILAIGGAEGAVSLREISTGRQIAQLHLRDAVNAVAFSPDGRHLAAGGADKTVRLLDVPAGTHAVHVHTGAVNAVAFSRSGKYLAIGSDDKAVSLLDVRTEKPAARYPQQDSVVAVAFSPDGKHLATGSLDNTARILDASTGKEESRLQHRNWVYAVAFSPDGRYLATGGRDQTALIMESATGKRVSQIQHQDSVTWVDFSPDGNSLLTFSGDELSHHLLRPEDLVSAVCGRLFRNLSPSAWSKYVEDIPYRKTCPAMAASGSNPVTKSGSCRWRFLPRRAHSISACNPSPCGRR